ncbi:uncharacterized protein K444DRAFT_317203 [Hyaloscypha bicolor E]|uniref:Uncharacterized protein n=1 Tax=Hyaloscypha bicolor E TaxID=1095630 RepID=A0A2J6TL36_9HELO|nr:uncharacterized protein K444DRAFT_317203 [Hyaloscypha bicolor E]PMD63745.1 hypothetical protein K444DRAFT_317203 [Hyaloscypha bicolor E]
MKMERNATMTPVSRIHSRRLKISMYQIVRNISGEARCNIPFEPLSTSSLEIHEMKYEQKGYHLRSLLVLLQSPSFAISLSLALLLSNIYSALHHHLS